MTDFALTSAPSGTLGALGADGQAPIEVRVVTIDPELAKRWLANKGLNRNLSLRTVDQLKTAIKRGEFQLNGETIKLASDGTVIDGQHRLVAIAQSDTSIDAVVVFGLPRASQETIDLGRKRTLGHVLALRGETYASMLAATLTHLWRYVNKIESQYGSMPTVQQALQVLEEHPGIRESLGRGDTLRKSVSIPPSVGACLHYVFSMIDNEDADDFFDTLSTGLGLREGDAIYALRRVLERSNMSPRHYHPRTVHALTVKAWNFWRAGTPIKFLRWSPSGRSAEDFPRPR